VNLLGEYDVIVVGAGMSGVVSAVTAARRGARTLLVESSGLIGGLITGGRLTKPTGIVQPGVYRELIDRAARHGGADSGVQRSYWGAYTGVFDPEVMQRAIIEALDDGGAELLLFASVTDIVTRDGQVAGVVVATKRGSETVTAKTVIDATGDGDVAVLAGATYGIGREGDGITQPMTSYFRILNVDFPTLAAYCQKNPGDISELVLPEDDQAGNEPYALKFFMTGLAQRIEQARRDGFDWIVPRNTITMKAGLLPGEINVNVTRVHGDALDPWVRTAAVLQIRRQAYCAFDFLKKYVDGFADAVLLDIAPVLGVRETRRIDGDYQLTEQDVTDEARFDDAIGLCNAPIDIHEPGGNKALMQSVGAGYGIPYRTMLPAGIEGLLTVGRCISADHVAFGSTRNTPACALTAQAGGIAAAMAASEGVPPRKVSARDIQDTLREIGVVLGTTAADVLPDAQIPDPAVSP
jgi:hypothetical protein